MVFANSASTQTDKGLRSCEQLHKDAGFSLITCLECDSWIFFTLQDSGSTFTIQKIITPIRYKTVLTSEAVDVMSSVSLWEACLVVVPIDGPDPRLTTSTALPRGDNGIPHTPICQPSWTAVVQSIIPGSIQLSCGGQLCPVTQTVGLGLPEGQTLVGGAMEHFTFTEGNVFQVFNYFGSLGLFSSHILTGFVAVIYSFRELIL